MILRFKHQVCHCPPNKGTPVCTCKRTWETKDHQINGPGVEFNWYGIFIRGEMIAELKNDYGDEFDYEYRGKRYEAVEVLNG